MKQLSRFQIKGQLSPEKHAGYFEAVIQLRPATDEMIRFIQNRLKERPSVFISRVEELKNGIDIYISSQKYAQAIGKWLKNSFNGELTVTGSLHTRDRMRSRDVYRMTILFRLRPKNEEVEEPRKAL